MKFRHTENDLLNNYSTNGKIYLKNQLKIICLAKSCGHEN